MWTGPHSNTKLASQILRHPAYPYTELLLDSVAKIGEKWGELVRLPDMETKE